MSFFDVFIVVCVCRVRFVFEMNVPYAWHYITEIHLHVELLHFFFLSHFSIASKIFSLGLYYSKSGPSQASTLHSFHLNIVIFRWMFEFKFLVRIFCIQIPKHIGNAERQNWFKRNGFMKSWKHTNIAVLRLLILAKWNEIEMNAVAKRKLNVLE